MTALLFDQNLSPKLIQRLGDIFPASIHVSQAGLAEAAVKFTQVANMIQTYEAVIDQDGVLRLLEPVKLPPMHRVLITVLDDEPELSGRESAILSEPALAADWLTPEEDNAWSHLAKLPSL